jgi:hypothetical protein
MNPFSSMLYDSTVFVSTKIFPIFERSATFSSCCYDLALNPRTGIDQLLLSRIPSFLRRNLFLDLGDLFHERRLVGEARHKSTSI